MEAQSYQTQLLINPRLDFLHYLTYDTFFLTFIRDTKNFQVCASQGEEEHRPNQSLYLQKPFRAIPLLYSDVIFDF